MKLYILFLFGLFHIRKLMHLLLFDRNQVPGSQTEFKPGDFVLGKVFSSKTRFKEYLAQVSGSFKF